jgi:hypothetical protein
VGGAVLSAAGLAGVGRGCAAFSIGAGRGAAAAIVFAGAGTGGFGVGCAALLIGVGGGATGRDGGTGVAFTVIFFAGARGAGLVVAFFATGLRAFAIARFTLGLAAATVFLAGLRTLARAAVFFFAAFGATFFALAFFAGAFLAGLRLAFLTIAAPLKDRIGLIRCPNLKMYTFSSFSMPRDR